MIQITGRTVAGCHPAHLDPDHRGHAPVDRTISRIRPPAAYGGPMTDAADAPATASPPCFSA
ncbi:MAG: hypothetical protein K0M78_10050, partial [Brevundimonas sp.]|nr:hypothetical protein [Brevundimonas sp.]